MLNSGFTAGLDPPTAGCAWQLKQLLESNRGPRPISPPAPPVTAFTSLKVPCPAMNTADWSEVIPAIGAPAFALPLRTPGSVARDCAKASLELNTTVTSQKCFMAAVSSKRAEEIDDVLLAGGRQSVERAHDSIRFGSRVLRIRGAGVTLDCLDNVRRPAVMQEENTPHHTP